MARKRLASRRRSRAARNSDRAVRVVVRNIMHPGKTRSVDAVRYETMRQALLKVLPVASPGLSLAEVYRTVLLRLPARVFPGGAGEGWWMKTVQLDLEARGIIARESTKPLRLHRSRDVVVKW